MEGEKKVTVSLQAEAVFKEGQYLAIWSSEGSFYLCISIRNVKQSSKSLKIRWLNEMKHGEYEMSYLDKIDVASVLTNVQLKRIGVNYQLRNKERERVVNILRNVEGRQATKDLTTLSNSDSSLSISKFFGNASSIGSDSKGVVKRKRVSDSTKNDFIQEQVHEEPARKRARENVKVFTVSASATNNPKKDRVITRTFRKRKNAKVKMSTPKVIDQKINASVINEDIVIEGQHLLRRNNPELTKELDISNTVLEKRVSASSRSDFNNQPVEKQPPQKRAKKNVKTSTREVAVMDKNTLGTNHLDKERVITDHHFRKRKNPKVVNESTTTSNASNSSEISNESNTIPDYNSSIEDVTERNKNPRSKKIWIERQTFASEAEAKAFVQIESVWATNTTNKLRTGKKVIYRCNNAKLRGKQCDAMMYLFHPSNKSEVILYTSADKHTCQPNPKKKMSDKMKSIIEQYFLDGIKTRKAIQNKLAAANIPLPSTNQLNNYISELNLKLYGPSTISIGELEIFLREHLSVPEDPNEPFIVDYICDDTNDGDFKFVVSTKTLLRNAVGVNIVSADTTYKMVWQGFPISPVGTIDKDRHFHLFGTLVSKDEKTNDFKFAFKSVKDAVKNLFDHEMNPKILIADAAAAIHNGGKAVFGKEIIILMCWFHLKKAVKKNIGRFVKNSQIQDEILSDLNMLNLAQNRSIFDKASKLFLHKYSTYKDFCLYFKKEWLVSNRNWYEGAFLLAEGVTTAPSTNNACESWNRSIKDEKTARNRYPLNVFKEKILQWTREWSVEYKSGAKSFIRTPTIDLPLWTMAYKWVKSNKPITRHINENGLVSYTFAAKETRVIENWSIITEWNNFKEYKERAFLGWKTYIRDAQNWIEGSCNCPSYMKKFMCKHIVGIAIRLKFVKPPIEAKALPLNQKRKRGRPSKAKKALLIQ